MLMASRSVCLVSVTSTDEGLKTSGASHHVSIIDITANNGGGAQREGCVAF